MNYGYIVLFLLLLLLYCSIWTAYILLQKRDTSELNAILKKFINFSHPEVSQRH